MSATSEMLDTLRYHGCTYKELVQEFFYKHTTDDPDFPKEDEIVFAALWNDQYEGSVWVVWQRDGKLCEMEAGHCSCNGFSDELPQFRKRPETTLKAIAMRGGTFPFAREANPVAWDALIEGRLLRS